MEAQAAFPITDLGRPTLEEIQENEMPTYRTDLGVDRLLLEEVEIEPTTDRRRVTDLWRCQMVVLDCCSMRIEV